MMSCLRQGIKALIHNLIHEIDVSIHVVSVAFYKVCFTFFTEIVVRGFFSGLTPMQSFRKDKL